MACVILKPGRDGSVSRRHPWIFSGAVSELKGHAQPGETVEVFSSDGRWLARGAWSPESQIRVRLWTFTPGLDVGRRMFEERIGRCLRERSALSEGGGTTAFRLVNAESDGLPGVVVDVYGVYAVCQFLSAGAEFFRSTISDVINKILGPKGIYERSDTDSRSKEGLPPRTGLISGAEPPGLIEVQEYGARYLVDVRRGHKTGFYLDQRDNRRTVAGLSRGRCVLNCFSYTGGFGVAAMLGGASSVLNVDTSRPALETALMNARLNGMDEAAFEVREADVFGFLREMSNLGRTFDLIVLDPPRFASSAGHVPKAARGYKDINLLAFRLLRPGGLLVTFSCSAHVGPALFQKIVADAALDAGRDARIVRFLSQASDHPVGLAFPEGLYLKGLVCTI